MRHFLDLHATDAADLRAILDQAAAMKAALVSELLPVPRTPQSRAWLLGNPRLKRSRFSRNRAFCRSTPTSDSRGRG